MLNYFQSHPLSEDNRWASHIPPESRECLTAGQLRDLASNPELSDSCYGFLHNMRFTIAYWQRAKMDLLSMFKTLGAPTYFITLTADDMNWPDLLFVLATQAGMEVTEESVS